MATAEDRLAAVEAMMPAIARDGTQLVERTTALETNVAAVQTGLATTNAMLEKMMGMLQAMQAATAGQATVMPAAATAAATASLTVPAPKPVPETSQAAPVFQRAEKVLAPEFDGKRSATEVAAWSADAEKWILFMRDHKHSDPMIVLLLKRAFTAAAETYRVQQVVGGLWPTTPEAIVLNVKEHFAPRGADFTNRKKLRDLQFRARSGMTAHVIEFQGLAQAVHFASASELLFDFLKSVPNSIAMALVQVEGLTKMAPADWPQSTKRPLKFGKCSSWA
ncbi:hypothetical protein AMAG_17678 [Allomyces macrogynus ATCC 38327]|uniref:Retrotransposon gag domain-containing protein n=1 Tax=Allomyces macrogynus (strain ATCC 38327) TaxID=578462 RepID=A0A0L0RWU5_ALLM3|nr:hypothetical protein AMAG_17678 [Allomyces macrogynus ATCC 38327]|eukprot:KNE54516.1 hypothetical protein AMAG_17678 [Allomyces macrogynus ATCC 38327]